jgi:hypothetical protein
MSGFANWNPYTYYQVGDVVYDYSGLLYSCVIENINDQPPSASWVNIPVQGPAGPIGPQGPQGNTGNPATVTVGTTVTLPPNTPATVSNSGTTSNAVFNFSIPQGAVGATGPQGQAGTPASINIGTTSTLPPNSQATVSNSGSSSSVILNFGIPAGVAGQNGQNGTNGTNATVAVGTTNTLSAGSPATVSNSGTASNAILNFGIPAGPNGTSASVSVGSTTTLPPNSPATVSNSGTSSNAILNFGIPQGQSGSAGLNTGPNIVVGGYGGIINVSSTGGINYPSATATTVFTSSINNIIFDGKKFIAVGGDTTSCIKWSPDGIQWFNTGYNGMSPCYDIAYGNGVYVAVGQSGTDTVATSTDGINWTGRGIPIPFQTSAVLSVGFGNGTFVIGSQGTTPNNCMASSVNGSVWTYLTLPSFASTTCYFVDYVAGNWYIAGSINNNLYIGSNLTSGNVQTPPLGISAVATNGSITVFGGNSTGFGVLGYSTSGSNFINAIGDPLSLGVVRSLIFSGTSFIVGGGNGTPNNIGFSYNGNNWYLSSTSLSTAGVSAFAIGV